MVLGLWALSTCPARATAVLTNGSFESPVLAAGAYVYPNGTSGGWTFTGNSGLLTATGCSPWYGSTPPSGYVGAQYAFLQIVGVISQAFTVPTSGYYNLTWLSAGRPNGVSSGGNETYNTQIAAPASLGGATTVLGSFQTTSGSNFSTNSSLSMALYAGDTYTLSFVGTGAVDNSAFLDNVSMNYLYAVPEPGVFALLAGSLLLLFVPQRRAE